MKTVKEVSRSTGVSVRTLHHYDAIGLLKPTQVTQAGYRLYDEEALERLSMILAFRELGFPLKEIQSILEAPDYDRNRVLEQQIALLEGKISHLQNRMDFARGIKLMGVKYMDLANFKPNELDDYSAQAKALYGKTAAYKEFEEKERGRSKEQAKALGNDVMDFFVRLGALRQEDPGSDAVQTWVKELQAFFTEHFYSCTPQVLKGLGEIYAGGGSMTENIDAVSGPGTGVFAKAAIDIYCEK